MKATNTLENINNKIENQIIQNTKIITSTIQSKLQIAEPYNWTTIINSIRENRYKYRTINHH